MVNYNIINERQPCALYSENIIFNFNENGNGNKRILLSTSYEIVNLFFIALFKLKNIHSVNHLASASNRSSKLIIWFNSSNILMQVLSFNTLHSMLYIQIHRNSHSTFVFNLKTQTQLKVNSNYSKSAYNFSDSIVNNSTHTRNTHCKWLISHLMRQFKCVFWTLTLTHSNTLTHGKHKTICCLIRTNACSHLPKKSVEWHKLMLNNYRHT